MSAMMTMMIKVGNTGVRCSGARRVSYMLDICLMYALTFVKLCAAKENLGSRSVASMPGLNFPVYLNPFVRSKAKKNDSTQSRACMSTSVRGKIIFIYFHPCVLQLRIIILNAEIQFHTCIWIYTSKMTMMKYQTRPKTIDQSYEKRYPDWKYFRDPPTPQVLWFAKTYYRKRDAAGECMECIQSDIVIWIVVWSEFSVIWFLCNALQC